MAGSTGEAGDKVAWISVHEQVIGVKLRNFAKKLGCSQNEALGLLVRFWLWGIHNANADGLIESATKEDVANDALNAGIDKRYQALDAVEAMIATGWIDFQDGCLCIHDWKEWQKQWYKAVSIRNYDNERKARQRNQRKEQQEQNAAADNPGEAAPKKGDSPESGKDAAPPPAKKAKNDYPTGFEEFWAAYPQGRRVGKGEAYKNYNARLKDGWSPEELLEAARNYAQETARRHTEPQYIKHPKTFLSADTPFTDFLPQRAAPEQRLDEEDPFAEWR